MRFHFILYHFCFLFFIRARLSVDTFHMSWNRNIQKKCVSELLVRWPCELVFWNLSFYQSRAAFHDCQGVDGSHFLVCLTRDSQIHFFVMYRDLEVVKCKLFSTFLESRSVGIIFSFS